MNTKHVVCLLGSMLVLMLSACAQQGQQNILRNTITGLSGFNSNQMLRSALTSSEVAAGLKEALASGVENAINILGRPGGFSGNKLVEIAVPDSLSSIVSTVRALGQGAQVDALEATMNQAAEQAVPEAAGILGDAIRAMTVDDAMAILNGKSDAATQYFRRVSEAKLAAQFKPIVQGATNQVGVTSAYKELTGQAGGLLSLAMPNNNLDIDNYITNEALDGLFTYIAKEEQNIRANPAARGTELLRRVFGG